MNNLRNSVFGIVAAAGLALTATTAFAEEHSHFDIAPCFDGARLLTGGLDHGGHAVAPPISVYGYEFGEDPFDPFNPTDPGVNQAAGTGNLPAGAVLRYNILSSLLYWDGLGDVNLSPVTGNTWIGLSMGATTRTLTGTSGPQVGSLIQSVGTGGMVHKHFVASLHADALSSNVPGDPSYLAPPEGVYVFGLELTLAQGDDVYSSEPLWIVFNNGLSEDLHDAAMTAIVPEPCSAALLGVGVVAMLRRRRRAVQ